MLRIDDLLEQHAFDDPAPTHFAHTASFSPQQQTQLQDTSAQNQPSQFVPSFRPTNLLVPSHNGPISVTKPIPPPAPLPRKLDSATHNQRVVHPPKEACFNLPIVFPSIPDGGTKSRVETQVRVTVDLADASSSSDPHKYDRVGSWKWLKLPPGTSTKRRTRKQGKIDASPQDTLNLNTEVVCASAPGVPIVSCSSCRAREAKRVAKKIAARVRPARSESESAGEDAFGKPIKKPAHEDTNSIIQFNCAEILDFSTGSVVLPLRITCYCRHHREKVGFLVRFTMVDSVGRVVGTGVSRPIMITDDHKTASANNRQADYVNTFSPTEPDWPHQQVSPIVKEASPPTDLRGPTRRKDKLNGTMSKKRPKPYDSSAKPGRGSREGSVSSLPSPSTTYSPLPVTRSPTPSSVFQNLLVASEAASRVQSQTQTPNIPALQPSLQSSDTSSPDILSTPLDHNSDVPMPEVAPSMEHPITRIPMPQISQPLLTESNMQQPQPQIQSPIPQPTPAMLLSQTSMASPAATSFPFLFFDQNQAPQNLAAIPMPAIHRLIPNMGPTFGGIEVTVLGTNFHANLNLRCIFGDAVASSTQRWSDNTLVCLLPPRAQPGVVAVWFEGLLEHPNMTPSLFTYSDESDRALMELALQVVGLKMTGKIEDAKNVAMRIVGGGGADNQDSRNGNNTSSMMQLASSSPSSGSLAPSLNRDLRSLLFIRAGETENFETTVIDFLSILDTPLDASSFPRSIPTSSAILHTTSTGQTLLHLAAFMRLPALVEWLVRHDADIDARDRNGYTALHFAVLVECLECARVLISSGADREIVNCLGKTAEEIAPSGFLDSILPPRDLHRYDDGDDGDVESEMDSAGEDEEAEWGDVEEDGEGENDEVKIKKLLRRRAPRRAMRKSANVSVNVSGRSTPRRSVDVSRATTPPPFSVPAALSTSPTDSNKSDESPSPSTLKKSSKPDTDPTGATDADADAKQTASFIDLIHRTFAQLSTPATLLPKPPQLQLPLSSKFPNLPLPDFKGNIGNIGMAMPGWNALPQMPQIPMVFPVFVPMPAWPSFLQVGSGSEESGNEKGGESGKKEKEKVGVDSTVGADTSSVQETNKAPSPREWRVMWEKWFALVLATTVKQQQQVGQAGDTEDMPPPEYTPRAEDVLGSFNENDTPSQKGKGKAKAKAEDAGELIRRPSPSPKALQAASAATAAGPGPSSSRPQHAHPVGYNDTPVPPEEVHAFTYQPPVKQKQKHKKRDHMLLRFWLPILLLSTIWAFYNGLRLASA